MSLAVISASIVCNGNVFAVGNIFSAHGIYGKTPQRIVFDVM